MLRYYNGYMNGKRLEHITAIALIAILLIVALVLLWSHEAQNVEVGRISDASQVTDSERIQSTIPVDAIELEWYRKHLDSNEKIALYDAMEAAIASMRMGVEVSHMSRNDVLECYWAVIYDHPEFFWLNRHYHYIEDPDGTYVAFDFEYFYDDKVEVQAQMHDIEVAADAIIAGAHLDSATSRAEYIYKWVGGATRYMTSEHDQTMLGVFVDHKAVCAGYIQAVQYLWLRAGVPCVRIGGYQVSDDGTVSTNNHTWISAVPENHLFFYDVTWDDQRDAYQMEDYYRMDQKAVDETHVVKNFDKAPREDEERDDAQEVVETAVRLSTGEHLSMPLRIGE